MSDPGRTRSSLDLRALTRAILDAVLAGDRPLLAVAHPLEFVCIPILRTRGLGVCGHIWQAGHSAPTVHCHSWDLDSEVVAGAVLNEVFEVTDCPDGDHRMLAVDSAGPLDRIEPTGRTVTARIEQRTLHTAGSSYSLRAGIFHRSTPAPCGPTITLVSGRTVPGARNHIVAVPTLRQGVTRREELPVPAARALTALLRSAIDDDDLLNPAHERGETPPRRSPVPTPGRPVGRT